MASPVFVDTTHYIGAYLERDELHEVAIAEARRLAGQQVSFVTIDSVLVEFLAYTSERGSLNRRRAVEFVEAILADPHTTVIPQTPELFRAGLNLYRRRLDKGYGLVGCMAMFVCTQMGITDVLTADRHFEQEGFRRLLA